MSEQPKNRDEIADAFTLFGFWTSRGVDISLNALLTVLQKHGVKTAATITTTGIFSDFALGNQRTIAACKENPALIPIATLDPRRHLGCEQALQQAIQQGCWLFGLFPETQGWLADRHSLGSLVRGVLDAGAVLMVEAAQQGAPGRVAQASADAAGPEKQVILLGVNYRNLGEALSVMKECPWIGLCTHSLTSVGAIEVACEQVGPNRLFFGSRVPLNYFSSAYLRVRYSGLSKADMRAVLCDNFLSLCKRHARAAHADD